MERNIQSKDSFQKLPCPFLKTNNDQFSLCYIGLNFLNKTLDKLKNTNNLNMFKDSLGYTPFLN